MAAGKTIVRTTRLADGYGSARVTRYDSGRIELDVGVRVEMTPKQARNLAALLTFAASAIVVPEEEG
jgi:hypothetical protein